MLSTYGYIITYVRAARYYLYETNLAIVQDYIKLIRLRISFKKNLNILLVGVSLNVSQDLEIFTFNK